MPSYRVMWNYRRMTNQSGLYKIHIEINLNRKGDRKYEEIKVPEKIGKQHWSGKENSWVKNTHPYAFEINEAIKAKLYLLSNLNKRYYLANKALSWPQIKRELQLNNNTDSFLTYFDSVIKCPKEDLDESTLDRYKVTLGHLKRWRPGITFVDLSEELFQEFKIYLSQQKELVGSTINGYFNSIKKVISWARKDNFVSKEYVESIFEDIHIKIGKPAPDHLEIHEITAWKNHDFQGANAALERDRNIFLIQIYTGCYYNDLREMLKTELKTDPEYGPYLLTGRYKNDNLSIIPLWKFKNAWPLIQKYLSHDPKDPHLFRRDIFIEDQPYNRSLKRIAEMLKWTRNVYNKLARKTNSQLYIRFGSNVPIVSKMLGHEKQETTNAYFEVNIIEVIEGTKAVDLDRFDI
jgi:site-specific recombinase XerD